MGYSATTSRYLLVIDEIMKHRTVDAGEFSAVSPLTIPELAETANVFATIS